MPQAMNSIVMIGELIRYKCYSRIIALLVLNLSTITLAINKKY